MSTNNVPKSASPLTEQSYKNKAALALLQLVFGKLTAPEDSSMRLAEEQHIEPAPVAAVEASSMHRRSLRSAFKLREELTAVLWDEVLREDADLFRKPFDQALGEVTHQAGLSFKQYESLDWAASVAMADIAQAAFVAGLQLGRDPFSLILQPAE